MCREGAAADLAPRRPDQLAGELTALGVEAAVTGRSVRAWLPGHEDGAIVVVPVWMADRRRRLRRRRAWWWQPGNPYG